MAGEPERSRAQSRVAGGPIPGRRAREGRWGGRRVERRRAKRTALSRAQGSGARAAPVDDGVFVAGNAQAARGRVARAGWRCARESWPSLASLTVSGPDALRASPVHLEPTHGTAAPNAGHKVFGEHMPEQPPVISGKRHRSGSRAPSVRTTRARVGGRSWSFMITPASNCSASRLATSRPSSTYLPLSVTTRSASSPSASSKLNSCRPSPPATKRPGCGQGPTCGAAGRDRG